ncbi:MAG: hypothetical protein EPO52_02145 [Herbiconiux sp.]|uniref:hypothetical protein n=1 Tax=Herbiconiux sp. TaxID=1871186 RepID=UPI001206639B|nr:hypothetical protein [Herbiconiux sp.]TAJ49773.1 MAG: hypothetical protein EPO52_02145 [Herbiconiux sp.]
MSEHPRDRTRLREPSDGMLTQLIRARRIGPRAVDEVRQNIARDSRLGIGYLGIGAVIVGVLLIGRGLVSFGWTWQYNDQRVISAAAWVLVIAAFALAVLVARRHRGSLPGWAFATVLGADAVALTLDQAATWLAADTASYLTVGVGIGATLLACVTFRPVSNTVIAVIVLTSAILAALIASEGSTPGSLSVGIAQLVLSVVPTLAGVIVVRSFGELVQRELDRTVAESTIGAPRYGIGLLASTELARLDLAAEELLQDVHTGRVDLPLDRDLSATASGLATDLRRMLIAGRRETWLHHAVTESAYLSAVVTLTDPDGLAGYLAPVQRDGLLSAIWLIVDESGRVNPLIEVSIGRPSSANGGGPDDRMVLPIAVSIAGVTRRRIEPAVWSALSRVGQYSVDARTGSLRVGVDAHVVVPDASR